jgi:dynein heavy chain
MSPLGDVFRQRLLKFPSLVNCSTCDMFTNWPEEALLSVGTGSLAQDATIDLGEDREGCIQMFKIIHQSVEAIALRYLDEMGRIMYVTPTSYLELLSTYKKTLATRKKEVGEARQRLAKGLDVLAGAAVEVAALQQKLTDSQPELEKTQKEVAETKIVIAKENADAKEVKDVVSKEEEIASAQAAEVKSIKDGADADLAVALPALEEAVKKVKQINVNDFYELKGIATPGAAIVKMFEVVAKMFSKKPGKVTDPKKKESDPDGYFELAKKELLSNPKKFLQDLIDYDKDHIPDALVAKVKPMMELEALSEAKVKSASGALVAVRLWVNAMITYHEVLKVVGPKRAIAAEMSAKLEVVMTALNEKRAKVKEINDKLARLTAEQNALEAKSKALNDEIEECGKKLVRAEKMIGGLAGEKSRWTEIVADLTEQLTLVIGDSLVASGAISYNGAFTSKYREELEETWRKAIKEQGIKATHQVTMSKVLGKEVTIK